MTSRIGSTARALLWTLLRSESAPPRREYSCLGCGNHLRVSGDDVFSETVLLIAAIGSGSLAVAAAVLAPRKQRARYDG